MPQASPQRHILLPIKTPLARIVILLLLPSPSTTLELIHQALPPIPLVILPDPLGRLHSFPVLPTISALLLPRRGRGLILPTQNLVFQPLPLLLWRLSPDGTDTALFSWRFTPFPACELPVLELCGIDAGGPVAVCRWC